MMVMVRILAALALATPLFADGLEDHLRRHGKPPADYLLSKLDDHRIVIVGENHWQRGDADLIAGLAAALRRRNVALAMEVFPAASQGAIDTLISAPEWNQALANDIMRAGGWPYVQYRDILRRAWEANRAAGPPPLRIIALGPPEDWRKQGIGYDTFMAGRIRDHATDDQHRVLVYCGMHHAFTRYLQVERLQKGRATEFMDRMGNILWRQFGQQVFLVALHKPEGCGEWEKPFATLCAPLGGVIDCAVFRNGGKPVGFDLLGSPIAEAKIEPPIFYATAHPLLRMADFADGYIWLSPVEEMGMVDLIPLEEYAPGEAASAERQASWKQHGDDLANPKRRASWAGLAEWRVGCEKAASFSSAPD